jgi:hypothetical protein
MKERLFLLLILIFTALSLTAVNLAPASITKPSVPEFTLEFIDQSYDEPTTYSINPYTGENVTHPGYHVPLIVFQMTIENQPFVPYYDEESEWNIGFYYNIRMKGSYSEDWIELYRPSDGYPHQSDSDYTVIQLGTLGGAGLSIVTNVKMIDVPSKGKADFQVEAMIGYVHRGYDPNATEQLIMFPWVFTGETSGWSNTQTITISSLSTPSPNPTASPTQQQTLEPAQSPEPQQPEPSPTTLVSAIVAVAAIIAVVALVYFKKGRSEGEPS